MKVLHITDKVKFVRHWGKWYRVQRGGYQWQLLAPIIHRKPSRQDPDPFDIDLTPEQAREQLEKRIT